MAPSTVNPKTDIYGDSTTSLAERLGYKTEPQEFPSLAERLQPISNTTKPNTTLGERILQMKEGYTTGYQNPLEYHRPEPPQGTADMLAQAIAQHESGGRQVKGASGEFGAFQFMPSTWEVVSKSMEGRVLPQTPENERKVATKKINQLYERFKAQGLDDITAARNVALVWNTSLGGSEVPLIKKGVNAKGVKYDSESYAKNVTAIFNELIKATSQKKDEFSYNEQLKDAPSERLARGIKNTLLPTPESPEQAQEWGLIAMKGPLSGKDMYVDPMGVVGSMKRVGAKALQETAGAAKGLTTKLLERLKSATKSETVTRQFIEDLTNQPDIKQPEKDLFRKILQTEGPQVNKSTFIDKVESELLPLDNYVGSRDFDSNDYMSNPRYENVTLPPELRGPVHHYDEHIYRSPIKTSAGDVHFSNMETDGKPLDNYFAHTRIEDLPDNQTRRVIEAQSDLFQKGRLEGEGAKTSGWTNDQVESVLSAQEAEKLRAARSILRSGGSYNQPAAEKVVNELEDKAVKLLQAPRNAELSKLEPYRNTWHERVIREEVKQAAKDGKTKLQFPTGVTAMNIEGLVNRHDKWVTLDNKLVDGTNINDGDIITYQTHEGTPHEYRRFLITKNNGDGTFKAVDSLTAENDSGFYDFLDKKGLLDDGRMPSLEELQPHLDKELTTYLDKNLSEQLSAKDTVDTSNPIYKFYEKEVARYLKNKYNAKLITDAQGVTWFEIDVAKDAAKLPIEAFAALPFVYQNQNNDNVKE